MSVKNILTYDIGYEVDDVITAIIDPSPHEVVWKQIEDQVRERVNTIKFPVVNTWLYDEDDR
jgi:hypothetical protein